MGGVHCAAMTTDSDRISRLEGIIEQIAATLTALQQVQEALRAEMQKGDADLPGERQTRLWALRWTCRNRVPQFQLPSRVE